MKLSITLAAICLVLSVSAPSFATAYHIDATYNGATTVLNPGSDNVVGTNFAAGDSFNYLLKADVNDFWSVNASAGFFPFLALSTNDSGTRTANFSLSLFLNGVLQFSTSDVGISNLFNHIGTNTINLVSGLHYDKVNLNYDLLSTSTSNNHISTIAWPSGVPFGTFHDITYNDNPAAVPEADGLMLLSLALVGVGFLRLRSHSV